MKKNENKKCCLNCTFCQRVKVIFTKPLQRYSEKKRLSLTIEEINKALLDDYSFLGNSKQERKLWIENYNSKKEAQEKKIKEIEEERKNRKIFSPGIMSVISSLNKKTLYWQSYQYNDHLSIKEKYSDYAIYGIKEPCPQVFDEDYLFCFREQWSEKQNSELEQERIKLKQNKCKYFYNYQKRGNKTLEACIEEQKENESKKINWKHVFITAIISPLIIGLILLAMQWGITHLSQK